MKILVFPLLIAILFFSGYRAYKSNRSGKHKKETKKWGLVFLITLLFFLFLGYKVAKSINQPDTQCTVSHQAKIQLPTLTNSTVGYFEKGNFDYDTGNCTLAIKD